MTTPKVPVSPGAGPAQSVVVVTDNLVEGGPAIPVYGWDGQPGDGRPVEGGPALRVVVIGDSDLKINGGKYWIDGSVMATPVASNVGGPGPASEGNIAIAVYPVNGWTGQSFRITAAEIGLVNSTTIDMTFSSAPSSSDLKLGFGFQQCGNGVTIVSATRQADPTHVRYVVGTAAVYGDTWTASYNAAVGDVHDAKGVKLGSFSGRGVTNNVAEVLGFPTTGILDNFNRSNVGPPPSANWTSPYWLPFNNGLSVASNHLVAASGDGEGAWTASQFGPDSEIYATVVTRGSYDIFLRLRFTGTGGDAHFYGVNISGSTWQLNKRVDSDALIGSPATQVIANGGKIGLEAKGNVITAYYNDGSGWVPVVSATDSDIAGTGYLWVYMQGTDTVLDDFGGGTIQ